MAYRNSSFLAEGKHLAPYTRNANVCQEELGGSEPNADSPGVGKVKSTTVRPIRVTLADDHAIVRQALASLLQLEERIEVVGEAADGQEAVALASHVKPDVILMDVSMPNMDGLEATRAIRAQHPDIRIIGLSMREDAAEAMYAAGASAYLIKGFSATELIQAIFEHARKSSP